MSGEQLNNGGERPQRQHVIPAMLQKRFLTGAESLWCYSRERNILFRSNPKNLFVERHIYTFETDTGEKEFLVERQLSALESAADPIICKVLDSARSGLCPILTENELATFWMFFLVQYRRVPDFFRNVDLGEPYEDLLNRGIDEYETEFGPIDPETIARLQAPEWMNSSLQRARMYSLLSGGRLLPVFLERGMCVARIGIPNKSFVLGSFPFARLSSGRSTHLSDPLVELWMPLAPDVAIASHGFRGQMQFAELRDPFQIRKLNVEIFKQSSTVASNSKTLLASLRDRR